MYVTKQIQNKLQKKKINMHQRSILRQMMSTCDKLGNSFLTKVQSKQFQQKEKQEKQLIRKTSVIQHQNNLERSSHDPMRCTKENIMEDFIYVKESKEIKQIKDLKQKMLPKVNKTNIQKKLKQLTYIRNMGFKSKNKKLQSFKMLTLEQDQQNTINKSWESFYNDKFASSPIQTPLNQDSIFRRDQKNKTKKPNFLIQKSKLGQFLQINQPKIRTLNNFSSSSPSFFMQSSKISCEVSSNNLLNTTSIQTYQDKNLNFKPDMQRTRISTRNRTVFKELLKNLPKKKKQQKKTIHNIPYPLSSDRRKQITQKIGLDKQKLNKQNAFKLYSLIKGGYQLDTNDINGQYISLNRFRQAKQNFKMLNTCFGKIREYRYITQQPYKLFNDGSFKSLVYLSEIQNKISPSLFKKIQQINKVVN